MRDLLGRPVVTLDTPELQRFIAGKVILVTGAGGSIGSELCRQCLRFCPKRLILVERAENALFEVDRELRDRWVGAEIVPVLADVTDRRRIGAVVEAHRPHVVFHAAAHKHVPMMEANPGEAIKNNVFGTQVAAEVASECGVGSFVLISTDKAVNPTSVMGATKRVAEMVVQGMHEKDRTGRPARRPLDMAAWNEASARTRFTAVRFGNVLDSSGSVVPIFRRQIERGGPVTVTHPEMRRYFMTIPEASQLVMQAAATGRGGEVFVLDMGEPVRIVELAERLIREYGKRPGRDIEIRFSGIRPGEKLFEELSERGARTLPTDHPKIRVWPLPGVSPGALSARLATLREVVDADPATAMSALAACVPEYAPSAPRSPLRLVDDAPGDAAPAAA